MFFFFSSLLNVTVELSISSLFPTIPSSRASSLQYASLPPPPLGPFLDVLTLLLGALLYTS